MPLYTDKNVRKQERCRYYTDKNIRKQASENILGSAYKHVLGTAGKRRKKTDASIAKIPGKHRDDTRRENTSVKIPEKYILITTKKTQAHKVRKEDKMNLKGRNFLKLIDFTPEEIGGLIDYAAELKKDKKNGVDHTDMHRGKNIVLIFEKTSTRTRCAFEVAAHDLGISVTYLDPSCSQIGKKESIADTARVLGRMFDGIEYRGYGQEIVEEIARYSGVPVWNGLTNEFHPTQILADFLTIREHFGRLKGINFVYMGDARYNMGNSLMIGCAKMGLNFTACAPSDYFPDGKLIELSRACAKESGAGLRFIEDPAEAVKGADVIYTDVWVSMGEPAEVWRERIEALGKYQVNDALMAATGNPECVFMHCLPAFHDTKTETGASVCEKFGRTEMEVTDSVFESKASIVFDEAENRMHTIKAVIAATL